MGKNGGKFNGSINLAIKIAAIILAIGAAWQMLQGHDERINNVEVKGEATATAVTKLQTDVEWIKKGIARIEVAVKK